MAVVLFVDKELADVAVKVLADAADGPAVRRIFVGGGVFIACSDPSESSSGCRKGKSDSLGLRFDDSIATTALSLSIDMLIVVDSAVGDAL